MKKVFNYLKPYGFYAVAAPLFMLLEVVCDLYMPALMAKIVDYAIPAGNINMIIRMGAVMFGVAIIGMVGGFGCTIFASIASQSMGADLRYALFEKIQSFSFKNLEKFTTASLVTRCTNDVVQVQNLVLMLLRIMVRAPLLVIGGIFMAVSINKELAMVMIIIIPFLAAVNYYVIKKGFPLFGNVQEKLDNLNRIIRENLTGIRVVKVFVREEYENKRFDYVNKESKDITVKASKVMALSMPLMMAIMNFAIIVVMWFGALGVNSGSMSIGHIIAFITYVTQILMSLIMMSFLLSALSRAKASTDRISEVLECNVDILEKEENIKEIKAWDIEFKNVSFSYDTHAAEPVLKNISLKIKQGESVGIIGATGAGKSTIAHLIPRFYDVTSGEIKIGGIDIKDYSLKELRKNVTVVLQESILFSGTIKENLKWGNSSAKENEIDEAVKSANAFEFINKFTEGYDSIIGQRGATLSGGQKQRVAIARALLKKPKIIIFDDSTSAVDMGTEFLIQNSLRENMSDTTKITIAQRITSVIDADKIVIIENGEIAGVGTHKELMENNLIYQDIFNSQMGRGDEDVK